MKMSCVSVEMGGKEHIYKLKIENGNFFYMKDKALLKDSTG